MKQHIKSLSKHTFNHHTNSPRPSLERPQQIKGQENDHRQIKPSQNESLLMPSKCDRSHPSKL